MYSPGPLAIELGPVVHVLGSVFVILGLGMGAVHSSWPLFNLVRERLPRSRGRFALAASPVLLVFVLAERTLLAGKGSFAEPLSFLGVIVISLLGGVFPVLLLLANRGRGGAASCALCRALGRPALAAGVYLLYLAGLFVHGLVIWECPVQRAAALAVGALTLGLTVFYVSHNWNDSKRIAVPPGYTPR